MIIQPYFVYTHARVMKCLCKLIRVGLFMGFIWESKLVYNCLHSFSYDS